EARPHTLTGEVVFHDPFTDLLVPVEGAGVAVEGPGIFTYTAADGTYRLDGVPDQGAWEAPFEVIAVDFERRLQGNAALARITAESPDEIEVQTIVLELMRGGIDGVVLNPLGQPEGKVKVMVPPWGETSTESDGTFSFDRVYPRSWDLVAHVDDGLKPGKVGYIGSAKTKIVFGGHRPFVPIRLVGSGVVRLHARTQSGDGMEVPIYYKPTYYSETELTIRLRGQYLEERTDPNGRVDLTIPVGGFELVAYNPFHGIKEINGAITYPGQVLDLDVVFEDAATLVGRVVDVDGTTPVPLAAVTLKMALLLPQAQQADALGNFRFELIPQGSFEITTAALVGTVERVGRVSGVIT
ncbi:MAG: hypothetical protein GY856_20670, partial [bacterium]|nr:hypothetical protein [bacterium]